MKQYIVLFATLVFAQAFTLKDTYLRDKFENELEELTSSTLKELIELKKLIEEVKGNEKNYHIFASELEKRISNIPINCLPNNMQFIHSFANTDACFNLSTTLASATDLAENVSIWLFNTSLTVGQIMYDFVNCASINPITAMNCMVNEIYLLKNILSDIKPEAMKFKQEISETSKMLRAQFDECVFSKITIQESVNSIISQAELCNQMRALFRPLY